MFMKRIVDIDLLVASLGDTILVVSMVYECYFERLDEC